MKSSKKIKNQHEIQEIIIRNIHETLDIDPVIKVNEFTVLKTDLGCDSIDAMEILIGCEKDLKLELSTEAFRVISTTFDCTPIYQTVEYFCNLKKVPFTNPVVENIVLDTQQKVATVKDAIVQMQNVRSSVIKQAKNTLTK